MSDTISAKVQERLSLFNQKNNFGRELGVQFEVRPDHKVYLFMNITEKHLSSPGVTHGGAISAFMDSILGTTALYQALRLDKVCSTVEFKINFIKPVLLGEPLEGIATIDYQGTTLLVVSGDIRNRETGALKAKGLGTFNLYPIEKKGFLVEGDNPKG